MELENIFKESKRQTIKHSTYFDAYTEALGKFKGKDIVFVEIGILGGGSLEAWRKYFGKNSRIIGVDINPELKGALEKDGFEIFIGDQAEPGFWNDFFAKVGNVDVILDDGGHSYKQQISTFHHTIDHINDGGMLIVEDAHTSYFRSFGFPSRYSFIEFSKKLADKINLRFFNKSVKNEGIDYAARIFSVQFFESIVVFHKNCALCKTPVPVSFGLKNESIHDKRSDFDEKQLNTLKKTGLHKIVPKALRIYAGDFLKSLPYRMENRRLKKYF